jgi:sugar (glycoside-pentoside-hexuronide) transporter
MTNASAETVIIDEIKVPMRTKLGFGIGDMGNALILNLKSIYMLYFWTDVFGISAAVAGTIFLLARMWDGINDPMMGYIADHTQSRWGRYRPYIFFGALPLAIFAVLTFTVPEMSHTGKIAWAAATYTILGMIATVVGVPYTALIPNITQDAKQRTSVTMFKQVFYYVGVVIVAVSTKPLVALFSDEKTGFQAVVIIFSIIAVIALWTTFFSYKEKSGALLESSKYKLREVYKIFLYNRPLQIAFAAFFAVTFSGAMQMSAAIYYCKYNLQSEKYIPMLLGVTLFSILLGSTFSPLVGRRLGKRRAYLFGVGVFAVFYTIMFFVPYSQIPLLLACASLASLGTGIANVVAISMLADTVEYNEWKTGIRPEGVIFSSATLVTKLGGAISAAISGFLLTFVGYVPNVDQTATALTGILVLVTLIPVGTKVVAMVLMYFYPLDEATYASILEDLKNGKRSQT